MNSFKPHTNYVVSVKLYSKDGNDCALITQSHTDKDGVITITKEVHDADTGDTIVTFKPVVRYPVVRNKTQTFTVDSVAQAELFFALADKAITQADKNYLAYNHDVDTLTLTSMARDMSLFIRSQADCPVVSGERWLVYINECKNYLRKQSNVQLIDDINSGKVTMTQATNRLKDIL